jgi:hypothetical protein
LIALLVDGEENHHDQLGRFGQLAEILSIILGLRFAGLPRLAFLLQWHFPALGSVQ